MHMTCMSKTEWADAIRRHISMSQMPCCLCFCGFSKNPDFVIQGPLKQIFDTIEIF